MPRGTILAISPSPPIQLSIYIVPRFPPICLRKYDWLLGRWAPLRYRRVIDGIRQRQVGKLPKGKLGYDKVPLHWSTKLMAKRQICGKIIKQTKS